MNSVDKKIFFCLGAVVLFKCIQLPLLRGGMSARDIWEDDTYEKGLLGNDDEELVEWRRLQEERERRQEEARVEWLKLQEERERHREKY
jgi:hypothetical protein